VGSNPTLATGRCGIDHKVITERMAESLDYPEKIRIVLWLYKYKTESPPTYSALSPAHKLANNLGGNLMPLWGIKKSVVGIINYPLELRG
jgi:hypothetical protein